MAALCERLNKLLSLMFIAMLSFVTINCSPKISGSLTHEGAVDQIQANQSKETPKKRITSDNILQDEVFNNVDRNRGEEFLSALRELNKNILGGDVKKLNEYEQILLRGCGDSLNSCSHVALFKQDPLSSQVAIQIARSEKNLEKYYMLVLIAFDLNNYSNNSNIELAYLQRSRELLNVLRSGENKKLGPVNVHERIISLFTSKSQSLSQIKIAMRKDCVSQIEFFNHYRGVQLKYGSKKNTLNMLNYPYRDEYIYLIDQIFLGHFNSDEAVAFWNSSKKDSNLLSMAANFYIQTEFLYILSKTNDLIGKRYDNITNLVVENLVQDSITQSNQASAMWTSFLDSAANIQSFLRFVASTPEVRSNLTRLEDFTEKTSFIKNLKYDIKVMSVYPQMLMIAYYISKFNFSTTIHTSSGNFVVKSANVVSRYLNGFWDPWYSYAHDEAKLSPNEILMAIQYAFQTDTFKSFNINVEDFFQVLASQLTGSLLTQLRERMELLTSKYQNSALWNDYQKVCKAIMEGRPVHVDSDILQLHGSVLFGERHDFIVNSYTAYNKNSGATESGSQYVNTLTDINPYGSEMVDQLERIRLSILPAIQTYKLIVQLYLDSTTGETSKLNGNIFQNKLEAYILPIKKAAESYIASFYEVSKSFDTCFARLTDVEFKLQSLILKTEVEHLKLVHRNMRKYLNKNISREQANSIFRRGELIANFYGFDQIDGTVYIAHPLDFYKRASFALRQNSDHIDFRSYAPQNLKELDIYTKGQSVTIQYGEDINEFVANGLANIANFRNGFTNWFNPFFTGVISIENKTFIKSILYRLGPMGFDKSKYETRIEDIFDSQDQNIHSLNIPESMFPFYKTMGKNNYLEKSLLDNFFIDPMLNTLKGYYDIPLRAMNEEYISSNWFNPEPQSDPWLNGYLTLLYRAQNFTKLRDNNHTHVVGQTAQLEVILSGQLREEILKDFGRGERLMDAVQRKYQDDHVQNKIPEFIFDLSRKQLGYYFSPAMIENFRSKKRYYQEHFRALIGSTLLK